MMKRRTIIIRLSVREDHFNKAKRLAREGGWHDPGHFLEGLLNIGIDELIAQRLDRMEKAYAHYRTHTMGQEVIDDGNRA